MRAKLLSLAVCLSAVAVGHAPASAATAPQSPDPTAARLQRPPLMRERDRAPSKMAARLPIAPQGAAATSDEPVAVSSTSAIGAPTSVTVAGAVGRAYLTWVAPAPPAGETVTAYNVYRGTTADNLIPVATTADTWLLNASLTVNATYYFAVAAVTETGEGARSAPVSLVVPSTEVVMSVPTHTGSAIVARSGNGGLVPIVNDGNNNDYPAISADGKWLAYASAPSAPGPGVPDTYSIFVEPANGGTRRLIAQGDDNNDFFEPDWSADGKWLSVTRVDLVEFEFFTELHRVSGGTDVQPLADALGGSWSAGASVVAIDAFTGDLVEYYTTGASRTVLSGAVAFDAAVSPDGDWIAFTRIDPDAEVLETSIWTMSRHGSAATEVVSVGELGGFSADLAWSRDGAQLYFTHEGEDPDGFPTYTVMQVAKNGTGLSPAGPDGHSWTPAHRSSVNPPRAVAPKPATVHPDFNGDGAYDLGVFRPSNGTWYVPGRTSVAYGSAGDVPVPADFTGDGRSEIAVFRPSNGTWYVRGLQPVQYGATGDIPVPGDYNGDGRDDIAVFRPSTGTWYVRGQASVQYGTSGDVPMPGHWRHLSRTDIAVFRPSTATWYFRQSPTVGGATSVQFGAKTDVPVVSTPSPFAGSSMGVFRSSAGRYYEHDPRLATSRSTTFGAPALAYASVPLGSILMPTASSTQTRAVLFQPATGLWHGQLLGGFGPPYGKRGDLPL